jgi:hypothetical protein
MTPTKAEAEHHNTWANRNRDGTEIKLRTLSSDLAVGAGGAPGGALSPVVRHRLAAVLPSPPFRTCRRFDVAPISARGAPGGSRSLENTVHDREHRCGPKMAKTQ